MQRGPAAFKDLTCVGVVTPVRHKGGESRFKVSEGEREGEPAVVDPFSNLLPATEPRERPHVLSMASNQSEGGGCRTER